MEQILENGDWAVGANGLPRMAQGHDAWMARARIRLTVPRGAFVHDPRLGSRLATLRDTAGRGGDAGLLALQYAQEALLDEPCVRVLAARVELDAQGVPSKAAVSLLTPVRAQEVTVAL